MIASRYFSVLQPLRSSLKEPLGASSNKYAHIRFTNVRKSRQVTRKSIGGWVGLNFITWDWFEWLWCYHLVYSNLLSSVYSVLIFMCVSILETFNQTGTSDFKPHVIKGAVALMWKKVSIYGCFPVLVLCAINAYMIGEHHHGEMKNYEHLRIFNRNFPWGDGKLSLINNLKKGSSHDH